MSPSPALCAICAGTLFVANAALAAIVAYPEYPPRIERDHAYRVTVSQRGGGTIEIPVYDHCEKSALSERTRGGDVHRRFCEFAFDGGPVRVDVAVCEDVDSYSVFPASRGLRHRFRDGVVSVLLDKPVNFGIRLNDSDKSILSVFADAPEDPAKIPAKDDPSVLYVDGWLDPPGEDGMMVVEPPRREVYIAPGAVLNSRLVVKTPGALVHGRGMVLDPFSDVFRFDQTNNQRRFVLNASGAGTVVEDVKIIDARTFNYGTWAPGITLRNVKALSSMMCSDGITSGGADLAVDGAWLYVGDNALVVSGLKDSAYRNVAIGTSCNAIFPQHGNENIRMEDIDVFRADEGLIKNSYNGALRRNAKWDELGTGEARKEPGPQDLEPHRQSFLIRNLSAVDCLLFPRFFVGGNMGTLPKTFAFENLSIPFSTGRAHWRSIGETGGVAVSILDDPAKWLVTDHYALAITNLWLGGRLADGFAPETVSNGHLVEIDVTNGEDAAQRAAPVPNRAEPHWTNPRKAYVGGALARDWRLVGGDGERRLPRPDPDENLLADNPDTKSAWQRCPSWKAKFDAVETDAAGARIYRLRQCERDAGMLDVITDKFLPHGPGAYEFRCEALVPGDGEEGGREAAEPVPEITFKARILSNEQAFASAFSVPADGEWHAVSATLGLDFDPGVTDLVAVHLSAAAPTAEIRFRNLSLREAAPGR